jgi:hypothetical protein
MQNEDDDMSPIRRMFTPPGQPAQPQEMPELPTPRPVRMPTETDPDMLAAAQRTRRSALRRRGRLSTIMTDQDQTGSSGETLGN